MTTQSLHDRPPEAVGRKPALGRNGAIIFVLVAIGFVYLQLRHSGPTVTGNDKSFFSVDDGKTWFVDSTKRIPPFEKDGKEAVQAFVYKAPDGTEFVGYLQRFSPESKNALEQLQTATAATTKPADPSVVHTAYTVGREVKRPGEATWVSGAHLFKAAQITAVKCPNGVGQPVPVDP